MAQLSPVDPSITTPFNPTLPAAPGAPPQFLPVSVEDVVSYLDLAKESAIKEEQLIAGVFTALSSDVRPLALGSVYRAKQQIKMLSEKLLSFHMKDKERITGIVSKLIRELYSHDYLIGRTEAKEQIGLMVAEMPESLEEKLISLFGQYSEAMMLQTPYNADILLGGDTTKTVTFESAFLESREITYVHRTKKEIKRIKFTQQNIPMEGTQERTLQEGWVVEKAEKSKS